MIETAERLDKIEKAAREAREHERTSPGTVIELCAIIRTMREALQAVDTHWVRKAVPIHQLPVVLEKLAQLPPWVWRD